MKQREETREVKAVWKVCACVCVWGGGDLDHC